MPKSTVLELQNITPAGMLVRLVDEIRREARQACPDSESHVTLTIDDVPIKLQREQEIFPSVQAQNVLSPIVPGRIAVIIQDKQHEQSTSVVNLDGTTAQHPVLRKWSPAALLYRSLSREKKNILRDPNYYEGRYAPSGIVPASFEDSTAADMIDACQTVDMSRIFGLACMSAVVDAVNALTALRASDNISQDKATQHSMTPSKVVTGAHPSVAKVLEMVVRDNVVLGALIASLALLPTNSKAYRQIDAAIDSLQQQLAPQENYLVSELSTAALRTVPHSVAKTTIRDAEKEVAVKHQALSDLTNKEISDSQDEEFLQRVDTAVQEFSAAKAVYFELVRNSDYVPPRTKIPDAPSVLKVNPSMTIHALATGVRHRRRV